MQNNPLVSVIMPVYNLEQYLPQSIESVLNQTYTNIELILVDDASTDKAPQICDEYAAKDNRVKVIHKENGGLNYSRMSGFEICTGEFICFIDCDDIYADDLIKNMLQMINSTDSDIAIVDKFNFNTKSLFPAESFDSNKTKVLNGFADVFASFDDKAGELNGLVWNKMFKRELFDNFDWHLANYKISQDKVELLQLCAAANRIAFNPYKGYFWRERRTSLSRARKPQENDGTFLSELGVKEFTRNFISQHTTSDQFERWDQKVQSMEVGSWLNENIAFPIDRGELKKAQLGLLSSELFNKFHNIQENSYLGKNLKFNILLLRTSPVLFTLIRKLTVKLGLVNNTAQKFDDDKVRADKEYLEKQAIMFE